MDIKTGGSTKSTTPRQDLHLLRSGRKRLHSSSDAAAIQGLAITKGSGHNYEIFETAYVPIGFRGVGQLSCETAVRIKRSGINPSIANETDFDLHQWLELHTMGSKCQDLEGGYTGCPLFRKASILIQKIQASSSERVNSPILGFKADASGSNLQRCGHGDPIEIGYFSKRTGGSGTPRIPNEADGQRSNSINLNSFPTLNASEICIGSSNNLPTLTLSNGLYLNSISLAEL